MLTTIYGKAVKLRILNQEPDLNKGAIYENVIAQELHAHGFPLYYYNSKKMGELDFVVEYQGNILPLEVKSGKDYERHSALSQVLATAEYHLKEALVFTNENVKQKGSLIYLPVYMVMFLQQEEVEFRDISVDRFKISL